MRIIVRDEYSSNYLCCNIILIAIWYSVLYTTSACNYSCLYIVYTQCFNIAAQIQQVFMYIDLMQA